MSIEVLSWTMQHSPAKLGDRLVAFTLADHAKADGTSSWPSVETIADRSLLSERQVQRCLRNLEESGEIVKTGASAKGTNIYAFPRYIAATQRGDKSSPLPPQEGRQFAGGGVTPTSPDPSSTSVSEAKASSTAASNVVPLRGSVDPDAELSSEVTEDGAQALVAGYVDQLKAIGAPAPKRLVGQVARQVGELVKEGLTADVIRKALELLVERRLNPAALPSLVPEAAAGPRQPAKVPRAAADAYRRDSVRDDEAERRPPPEESLEDVERILGRPVAGVLRGLE